MSYIKTTDKEIVEAIRTLWKELGHAPSNEELREKTGLKSNASICCRLRVMKNRGLIHYVERQPRTVTVVGDSIEYKEGVI